jgi:hypothetical protein
MEKQGKRQGKMKVLALDKGDVYLFEQSLEGVNAKGKYEL